jgi:hypothetical protein
MSPQIAAVDGVSIPLQVAASATGPGTILAIPSSFNRHNFLIRASAGVASGAVQVETSNDPTDAGVWAPLTASPITTSVASSDILVAYTGILNFVRARISTVIAGGTVSVDYEGGKQ